MIVANMLRSQYTPGNNFFNHLLMEQIAETRGRLTIEQFSKLQIRISQFFATPYLYHSFWQHTAKFFVWLWRFIWWFWSTVIIGGLLVGILITLATKGTSGLTDPRTWVVIQLLIMHPILTAIVSVLAIILTFLAYFAHHHQHLASQEKQSHHTEAVLERVEGVRKVVEELNTRVTSQSPTSTMEVNQDKAAASLPIWNVPNQRNPFFTGREQILNDLDNIFFTSKPTMQVQPQAINGLGGIGKTQTTIEFAYRHRNDYNAVLWVRADSYEALVAGYVTIAGLLGLPEKDVLDQTFAVNAVKRWLEKNTGWLLILDNADDLDIASQFLPLERKGHILLTSRAQTTGGVAQSIEIQKMGLEEGALFLLRRAKIIAQHALLENVSASDRTIATEIVQAMDGLPLALDQAGAYLEETDCSLSNYLHLYQTHRAELLKARGELTFDHPDPVTTTFSLAFEKLQQTNSHAADLLRLCAFLAPDAIPEEIFIQEPSDTGSNWHPLISNLHEFNMAIKALLKLSLIRRNNELQTLAIHRLVQAVLKDGMSRDIQYQWAQCAVQAINSVFPFVKIATWPQCQHYLPHALLCAIYIEQWNMDFPEATRLLNQAGYYLTSRARYIEAEPLLQQALAIRKKALGAEHPDTAQSLNNLGWLYFMHGKYEQAEPLYQQALAIREQVLGAEHPDTAESMNRLALLYERQSKYKQAEILFQRARVIYENALGAEHPKTAWCLNGLAWLYHRQGKYEQAEPLYQRALAIREHKLEPEHPDTAQNLNNLAGLYERQGKYEQAEPLYQRALAIRKKVLGEEHPSTAHSLNGLAWLYFMQGKYEQAEPLFQRSLMAREQVLGPEHPETARSLNGLGLLYYRQGKYEQAEPLLERALMIFKRQLGPEHPDTTTGLNSLAGLYERQGKYEQAEPLYQQALAIRERVLGPNHPATAACLNQLAEFYLVQGRYEQAEPLFQRALVINEQNLKPEHPHTAYSLNGLGLLYYRQGKYEQAEPPLEKALTIREHILGLEHPDTVESLNILAEVYKNQSKYEQLTALLQRMLSIHKQ